MQETSTGEKMRYAYVFRLTQALTDKLDIVAPASNHRRSAFVRDSIEDFLCQPRKQLFDRPRLANKAGKFTQICCTLTPDLVEAIKAAYADTSVSVVIEAAVAAALEKKRR